MRYGARVFREASMLRLAITLYTMAAPTLAGVGVVIALVAGYGTLLSLIVAALVGFIIGIPAAYLLAKALYT